MSDEKKYTERDLIRAKRDAYLVGYIHAGGSERAGQWRATEYFPLPKVTRPRVVTDDRGAQWQVRDGEILGREAPLHMWLPGLAWHVTPSRVRLWADLLANPTEEVDGE